MTAGPYLAGLCFFVGTVGSALAAAALLTRRRLSHLDLPAQVLAFGVLATAAILVAHLLPGVLGLLSRTSALVSALALLVAASRVPAAGTAAGDDSVPPVPPSGRFSWALAAVAAGAVVVAAMGAAWAGSATPSTEVDTLTFHLPNIARWIQ